MPLSAEEVRAAAARLRKTEDVNVEEMGGAVRLRSLSAGDIVRLEFEKKQALLAGKDVEEIAFEYVARSWVDHQGEPLFPLEEGIAVARSLDEKPYATLVRAVLRLNGITDTAVEDAKKN